MLKYTNHVRNFCKQKIRPLPEFPGMLRNDLGVLHNILGVLQQKQPGDHQNVLNCLKS